MTCLGVSGELGESKFEWKIANFFSLSATKDVYYISPSFVFDNTSLHLGIFPVGTVSAKAKPGFLSVFLENETKDPLHVNIELLIKKADGTMTGYRNCDTCIETDMGYHNFYKRSRLHQRESEMMPSSILTIVCILKPKNDGKQDIIKGEKIENSHEKQIQKTLDHRRLTGLEKLSENFKHLFGDKDACDTILKVKDKEYKAHRLILMARSSVFAATFKHDSLERQTGIIAISDCDPESFQLFLDYLYSGQFAELTFCSALNLYCISDKYDVAELKEFCLEYLMHSLTVENVCELAIFADKYDEKELFSAVQDFFNKKVFEILLTSDWDDLLTEDHCLANKLLKEMSKFKPKG